MNVVVIVVIGVAGLHGVISTTHCTLTVQTSSCLYSVALCIMYPVIHIVQLF